MRNKRSLIFALLLALAGAVLRFCFNGVGYIGYTLIFIAILIAFFSLCRSKWLKALICLLTAAGVLYFAAVEVPIVRASHGDVDRDYDYIIVLGAAVHGTTPSLSMTERTDAAISYLKAHPDAIAIVSGGQGEDEDISEAEAMSRLLSDSGIDQSRIILEPKSESTRQNIANSFDIINERGGGSAAVVTSEYHIYRAKLIAHDLGYEVGSIAAHTTYLQIAVNYFIREAFGVTYQLIAQ